MSEPSSATSIGPGIVVGGRYRIVEALGQGGIGAVWIAEHVELGRRVALKVLQKQIGKDPEMRQRFEREAKTLAAMAHPNVVALNDYGLWNGSPFLVMELLEGRTLRELLDGEGTLPFPRARHVAEQILRALGYAHGRGVIHRDLKPGNVFLQRLPDDGDHVKLLDFGFAKFLEASAGGFVSKEGIAVGTPAYMAPEQGGGVVDARADLYATGVLTFEMLLGVRPFEGEPLEMIRARKARAAPSLADVRPGVVATPALDRFLAKALAREPEERFGTAAEMGAALADTAAEMGAALADLSERALTGGPSTGGAMPRARAAPAPPTEELDSRQLAKLAVRPAWRAPLLAGVTLGALVMGWSAVMMATGWLFDPATSGRFALVVGIELVTLLALLRSTSRENGYRAQVGTGTLASAIGALVVGAQSLVLTGLVFPAAIAAHPELGSPLAQALSGAAGTLVTGVVASALFGAVLRRRS